MDRGKQTSRRETTHASARRRRAEEQELARLQQQALVASTQTADQEQEQERHTDEECHTDEERQTDQEEDEDADILTGPCPGGPEDPQLIPSFKTHVAYEIWNGIERDVLRCWCHTTKLYAWKLEGNINPVLQNSRIANIRSFSYKTPNKNLICAFVERWQPETNTFHMPFGEMTITLDDVFCLTGLPVSGLPVVEPVSARGPEDPKKMIRRLLGVSEIEAQDELLSQRGSSVRMEWLRARFESDVSSTDSSKRRRAARAYLWYVLGCTIFADKSGTRVDTKILALLENVNNVDDYAWGAAALAFLYRQLGVASRSGVRQICGYLTLLEAWIFEYFPFTRPTHNVNYRMGEPLAMRWANRPHAGGGTNLISSIREVLDNLQVHNVNWTPYNGMRDTFPRDEVTFFHGCIRAFDNVEPYHPDRVLRQFGLRQKVPYPPLFPNEVRRGNTSQKYKLAFHVLGGYFQYWRSHVLSAEARGGTANPAWECSPDYMDWYKKFSHPIVQNPKNVSSAAGTTSTQTGPQPWDMIGNALGYLEPVYQTWISNREALDIPTYETAMVGAYRALKLQSPEEPESSTRATGRRRRRRS